jgi:protein-disulfide isomerase
VARDRKAPQLITGKGGRGNAWIAQALVASALVALVAVIGFSIAHKQQQKRDRDAARAAVAAQAAHPAAYQDGFLRLGNPNAKVVVRITEDFQCPICGQFEAAAGPTVTKLISDDKAAVEYRPIALIDRNWNGQTTYSARSAAAAACVADTDLPKWQAFHAALFAAQPAEGSAGPSDDQLLQTAGHAGAAGPGLAQCVSSQKYLPFVNTTTDTALKQIKGTPTILVNGTQLTDFNPDSLLAAVAKAQAQ